jgi:glycerol-3-phosphate dehydrogenase
MAEDALSYAILAGGLEERPCITRDMKIHGYTKDRDEVYSPLSVYGNERHKLETLKGPFQGSRLSKPLGIIQSQVIWAARKEMARTVEDVLARRTRALFLDARESLRIAPQTAHLLSTELGKDKNWVQEQLAQYEKLVNNFLVEG